MPQQFTAIKKCPGDIDVQPDENVKIDLCHVRSSLRGTFQYISWLVKKRQNAVGGTRTGPGA